MVQFIFLIAIVNLGLGFALAVFLARRYRELVAQEVEEPAAPSERPEILSSPSAPDEPKQESPPESSPAQSAAEEPPGLALGELDINPEELQRLRQDAATVE